MRSFMPVPVHFPQDQDLVNLQPFARAEQDQANEMDPAMVTQQKLSRLGSELEELRKRLDRDFSGGRY